MRVKIAKKEIKESIYWLKLLEITTTENNKRCKKIIAEATEIMKILGAILEKCK